MEDKTAPNIFINNVIHTKISKPGSDQRPEGSPQGASLAEQARVASPVSETEVLTHEVRGLKGQLAELEAQLKEDDDNTQSLNSLEEKVETLRRQIADKEGAIQEIIQVHSAGNLRSGDTLRRVEDAQMNQELLAMHDDVKRGRKSQLRSRPQSQKSQLNEEDKLTHSSRGEGKDTLGETKSPAETAPREGDERTQRAGSVPGDTDQGADMINNYGNHEAGSIVASTYDHLASVKGSAGAPEELALESGEVRTNRPTELDRSPARTRRRRDGDRQPEYALPQGLGISLDGNLLISGQRASLSPPRQSTNRGTVKVKLNQPPNDEVTVGEQVLMTAEVIGRQSPSRGYPRQGISPLPPGNSFKASRRQTRPKQQNLQLEVSRSISPAAGRPTATPGEAVRNHTPKQENVKQYQVLDKKFNVLMPTQYNTAAILAQKLRDPTAKYGPPPPRTAASRPGGVLCGQTLQYSTALRVDALEFDPNGIQHSNAPLIVGSSDVRSGRRAKVSKRESAVDLQEPPKADSKTNIDIENVTNDEASKDSKLDSAEKKGSEGMGVASGLFMTRNDTEGPKNLASSSMVSENANSPTTVPDIQLEAARRSGPETRPPNLELKTIFSHKIDIKYNKNGDTIKPRERKNPLNTLQAFPDPRAQQRANQVRQALRSQGAQPMPKSNVKGGTVRPSNGAPTTSPRPAIILIDKARAQQPEAAGSKHSGLSNILSGQGYSMEQNTILEPRHAERVPALPNLQAATSSSSKRTSVAALPEIPTATTGTAGAPRAAGKKRRPRNVTGDKAQYIGSFVEMPMQYNNAFVNSFYNTQLDRVMHFSRASRGSKRSLLFSPKVSEQEPQKISAQGRASRIETSDAGGPGATDRRVRIILQEQQVITESKIKIRSTSQNKKVDPAEADQKKAEERASQFAKNRLRCSKDDEQRDADPATQQIPSLMTEECFEQQDQMLTNKLNHYYKQLKSREKDQSIVISHPYDLSHLAVTQKCFLTSNVLKPKHTMPVDWQRAAPVSTARPGAQRPTFQQSKSYRFAQPNPTATPRQRKEEWIRKAAEGKEQQLLTNQRPNQQQRVKTLFDYAQNQKYTLQADGAKIFDKTQLQVGRSPPPVGSPTTISAQGRDPYANSALPNRNTPKIRRDPQMAGCGERRDMNIHRAKPLSPAPLPNQHYLVNFRHGDQLGAKRASLGLGPSDATYTSRIQGRPNDPSPEPRSARRADASAGRQSPMYCVIATERSHAGAGKILEQDDGLLRGGASADFRDPATETYQLAADEATSLASCPASQLSPSARERAANRSSAAPGDFSFRPSRKPVQQTIVLQNQREQNEGGMQDSVKTVDQDRQQEWLAQSSAQSQQQKNRLVAYSSLGSSAPAEPQHRQPSGREDQDFGGAAASRHSQDAETSQTPRYVPNPSTISSPPGHSTSANVAQAQPSIFFGTDHGSSTQQTHLQSTESRPKKENWANLSSFQNEVGAQRLQLMNAAQIGNGQGFIGPTKVIRLDQGQQQTEPRSSINSGPGHSPRNGSPGSHTGQVSPRQSGNRQTLGRKQVGGYAGGVIGSGVDASLYHTGQATSQSRKRPFTKSLKGEKKMVLYNHLESMVPTQEAKDQAAQNPQTLTIESQAPSPGKRGADGEPESPEQTKPGRLVYDALELKGSSVAEQRGFDHDGMALQNSGIPIDGKVIKKIQLTQRNNNIAAQDMGAGSAIGGSSHNPRIPQRVADADQGTSVSPIPNTSRSFKMDDILGEPKDSIVGGQGPCATNEEQNLPNQAQREAKFRPLNTREVQMQISSEEYANLMKAGKFKENDTLRRRSTNPLNASKNQGHQQRRQNRKERSKEAHTREEELLQEDLGEDKPLDPWVIEFLRQKTLYKMQKDLWKVYEREWQKFTRANHLTARAPIPPNCRILTLHVYLNETKRSIASLKCTTQLPLDMPTFAESHKEAKRRLQMCSFRIIDENVFIEMKTEMNDGYQVMVSGAIDSPDGPRFAEHKYLIVEHSGDPHTYTAERDRSSRDYGQLPTLLQALQDGTHAAEASSVAGVQRSDTELTKL